MKQRIVIFAPYPKGQAPSQRFRFEQYLSLLEEEGYEIVFESFLTEETWKLLYKKGAFLQKGIGVFGSFLKRWKVILFGLKKNDIIFIHREMAHIGPPIFEWILSKVLKKKYIYDFDDAIWLPNFSKNNAKVNRLKAYWKVNYCIKWAGEIAVGNDYLLDYTKKINPAVMVIPTTIDLLNHHNLITNHNHSPLIIGWTGTITTMRYLDDIIPVLQELEKEHHFIFRVISNVAPNFKLNSLEFVKWNKETEIQDLSKFNIGIMPLVDDLWAKGKCGFKALQYMALEIPSVVSPVGVNTKIIHDKENGYLATESHEWKKYLTQLIEDKELRIKIGQAGRKTIENEYSVQANYSKYLEIIKNY